MVYRNFKISACTSFHIIISWCTIMRPRFLPCRCETLQSPILRQIHMLQVEHARGCGHAMSPPFKTRGGSTDRQCFERNLWWARAQLHYFVRHMLLRLVEIVRRSCRRQVGTKYHVRNRLVVWFIEIFKYTKYLVLVYYTKCQLLFLIQFVFSFFSICYKNISGKGVYRRLLLCTSIVFRQHISRT